MPYLFFVLKVGAEKRPTWENLLRRPQHEDYYLGETTAPTPRVSLWSSSLFLVQNVMLRSAATWRTNAVTSPVAIEGGKTRNGRADTHHNHSRHHNCSGDSVCHLLRDIKGGLQLKPTRALVLHNAAISWLNHHSSLCRPRGF